MVHNKLRLLIYGLTFLMLIVLLNGCAVLAPKTNSDLLIKDANMPFMFVKGGAFQMGSDRHSDEKPIHTVTVGDLFVGAFEVTFAQYDQFCQATPNCGGPSDEGWGREHRPAINVSWHDANAYAAWLSEKTGNQFRLPSEAEWEYFARSGMTTSYWTGKSLEQGKANCAKCGTQWDNLSTAPVASFAPSPWGLYDTIGNVQEWVLDDFNRNYQKAPIDGTALTDPQSKYKAFRGGSWNSRVLDVRSATRDRDVPDIKRPDIGFRLVLQPSAELPTPKAD